MSYLDKPIWFDYNLWEDYNNGMYLNRVDEEYIEKSKFILSENCYLPMKLVVVNWPISSAVNFTQLVWNKKAWLGQACCCFNHGSTLFETCQAWGRLTKKQRIDANNIADQVIEEWKCENI